MPGSITDLTAVIQNRSLSQVPTVTLLVLYLNNVTPLLLPALIADLAQPTLLMAPTKPAINKTSFLILTTDLSKQALDPIPRLFPGHTRQETIQLNWKPKEMMAPPWPSVRWLLTFLHPLLLVLLQWEQLPDPPLQALITPPILTGAPQV